METKKAKEFYNNLSELNNIWSLYEGDKEFTEKQLLEFAQQYAKHVTTSQQQTIERLREALKEIFDLNEYNRVTEKSEMKKSFAVEWSKAFKKAEQLLNTTKPMDQ